MASLDLMGMFQKAGSYIGPILKAGMVMIISVPKEVEALMEERENIRDLIKKAADRVVAAEEGDRREFMKKKVTQLRIIDFRIEDVIDEWNSCLQHEKYDAVKNEHEKTNERTNMKAIEENVMHEEWQHHGNGSCVTLPFESANKYIRLRCYDRLQIAFKIKNIKSDFLEIKEQQDPNINKEEKKELSRRNPDQEWMNLQRQPYRVETEIVGFEAHSEEMMNWLEDGRAECNVMVLVGMAGQGKTTLAKKIYDNNEVIEKFKVSAWINVSDFNDPKEFFRFMLEEFYQEPMSPPYGYLTMGLKSLTNEVKKYLRKKRYVIFFDDVWSKNFWKEIKQIVGNNNENGSRIIITTRNKEVAYTCENSTVVEVQPLSETESSELFWQTAFQKESCPKKFKKLSSEIVKICEGLPLGIVAIGKLVSARRNDAFKWKSIFGEEGVTKILCLGYDNLPRYLKPCLLYFGIYPQGYIVKTKRLIRQWIAEGFVRYETRRSVEEVAQDYLTSLIDRNLVLVSSFTVDGKPKSCHVHYLVHDMIIRKFEDLSFCQCVNEENRPEVTGVTRRMSVATNSTEELPGFFDGLVDDIESLYIRSLHFFTQEELPEHFASKIPSKYKQLKVLDFENSRLLYHLENLGDLIHLKYLSFRNTKIQSLPKSIDKLENLETLDFRQTDVNEMPNEVVKLRKLRQFLGSVQLKVGIGGMRSLQTLRSVKLNDNVGLIEKELGKLWQIKDLGLNNVEKKHASALFSAINKMKNLEKLHIAAMSENEVIDLKHMKKPSMLQKLYLQGKLHKLPEWIPDLDRLTKLVLSGSKLTDEYDPLGLLKDLPNLLFLSIINDAYVGENFDFEDGDFEDLEELKLGSLHSLSSINVHSNALPSLKKLHLWDLPQLKEVPFSIQHLKNLEHLNYQNMSDEFKQILKPILKDLPHVRINGVLGS